MADAPPPETCHSGAWEFERVVVERRPHGPITTDFVACTSGRAVYFDPLPPIVVTPRAQASTGHGGPFDGSPIPPHDSDDQLKRDAAEVAKDYVKPGRHTPPRRR